MFGFTDKVLAMVFGGVSAILLALCAVLYIEANGFFWIDGLKDKLEDCERDRNELRGELQRISTAKNEQEVVTVERIKIAERGNRQADEIAKKIEQAPVEPGACKTPDIIMGSDI